MKIIKRIKIQIEINEDYPGYCHAECDFRFVVLYHYPYCNLFNMKMASWKDNIHRCAQCKKTFKSKE